MKRGEIWHVDLDPVAGNEQRGRRYVLIVSPDAFNKITQLAVICPITSGGNFARYKGFAVPLATTGTKTTGVVLTHQVRTIDLKARQGKRLESVPPFVIDDVLAKLQTIIDP